MELSKRDLRRFAASAKVCFDRSGRTDLKASITAHSSHLTREFAQRFSNMGVVVHIKRLAGLVGTFLISVLLMSFVQLGTANAAEAPMQSMQAAALSCPGYFYPIMISYDIDKDPYVQWGGITQCTGSPVPTNDLTVTLQRWNGSSWVTVGNAFSSGLQLSAVAVSERLCSSTASTRYRQQAHAVVNGVALPTATDDPVTLNCSVIAFFA